MTTPLQTFRRMIIKNKRVLLFLPTCLLLTTMTAVAEDTANMQRRSGEAQWVDAKNVDLAGFRVTLSEPRPIARSHGYLWFPTLYRTSNSGWLAAMSDYADLHVGDGTCQVSWSDDGGYSWSPLVGGKGGDSFLTLPSGDSLLLPYYTKQESANQISRAVQRIPRGRRELKLMEPGVKVTGWPRPPEKLTGKAVKPEWNLSSFVFTGQTVAVKDGKWLATLYGYLSGTNGRYSLVVAESSDGLAWQIRSVVADHDCPLKGVEGPNEAALCRLRDGRLMCVFRIEANKPYGQCFSDDEGRTWSPPQKINGPYSVQPSLAVRKDGSVVLSGGRPGLNLWINADGSGLTWERLDLRAHHNACLPNELIQTVETLETGEMTTGYTEVAVLDDTQLLVIYDRVPHGWTAIPADSKEMNSVWIMRATLEAARRK